MAYKWGVNPVTGKLDIVGNTTLFVPYTGATANVDLGTKELNAGATTVSSLKSNGNIVLKSGKKLIFDGA
jgi:hypothetical protein